MDEQDKISGLIVASLEGTLTADQQTALDEWLAASMANRAFFQRITNNEYLQQAISHQYYIEHSQERALAKIISSIRGDDATTHYPVVHRVHFLKTAWFRYAAAIILLFGISTYLYITQQKEKPAITETKPAPVKNDIMPGSDRAVLTLSNGQQIELNNATSETIKDGTLSIENTGEQLIYFDRRSFSEGGKKGDRVAMNTMSTQKGGQYQLTLSDGTKVWLNAASSITYPTAFTGNERMVSIEGEAYFDVTKDATKPFIVKTNKENITVLGTQFNVNAYRDEPVTKTSLVEGSVKVGEKVLKPGQAYANGNVLATNIEQDIAWKNGVFNFNNADLFVVMRQISRWYDIDVHYDENIAKRKFWGELSRKLSLSQVLEVLQVMQVNFRIDGKDLYITNKPS